MVESVSDGRGVRVDFDDGAKCWALRVDGGNPREVFVGDLVHL